MLDIVEGTLLSLAAGIACAMGVGYLGLKVLFHWLINDLYCRRDNAFTGSGDSLCDGSWLPWS